MVTREGELESVCLEEPGVGGLGANPISQSKGSPGPARSADAGRVDRARVRFDPVGLRETQVRGPTDREAATDEHRGCRAYQSPSEPWRSPEPQALDSRQCE